MGGNNHDGKQTEHETDSAAGVLRENAVIRTWISGSRNRPVPLHSAGTDRWGYGIRHGDCRRYRFRSHGCQICDPLSPGIAGASRGYLK